MTRGRLRGAKIQASARAMAGSIPDGGRVDHASSSITSSSPDDLRLAVEPIHVTRWGTTGPQVLMIHGGIQGSRFGGADHFPKQRRLAECGWRIVLPDRPGHGRTPTRGPEDMELDGIWLADMLDEHSHLVGHSYGGCAAVAAAALRPEAVKSLTLIEAPLFAAAADDPLVQERQAAHERLRSADMDPIARLIEFRKRLGIRRGLLSSMPTRDEMVRMGKGLAEARSPFDWDGTLPALEAVRAARIPVLVVTGGWNPVGERVADVVVRLTEARRLVIDVDHHFPHLASDDFNEELHRFLTEVESAPPPALRPGEHAPQA